MVHEFPFGVGGQARIGSECSEREIGGGFASFHRTLQVVEKAAFVPSLLVPLIDTHKPRAGELDQFDARAANPWRSQAELTSLAPKLKAIPKIQSLEF
jgi:hypothetical protein